MVLVQDGTSVLYKKWTRKQAVHKETPPPSLGGWGRPLVLQDCRVYHWVKGLLPISREAGMEVNKSLPALSPPANFSTHRSAQHPHRHTSVFSSSLPQQYPSLAGRIETTFLLTMAINLNFTSHFSDASWDQVFVKHFTAVLHHLNHREIKSKFVEWDSLLFLEYKTSSHF